MLLLLVQLTALLSELTAMRKYQLINKHSIPSHCVTSSLCSFSLFSSCSFSSTRRFIWVLSDSSKEAFSPCTAVNSWSISLFTDDVSCLDFLSFSDKAELTLSCSASSSSSSDKRASYKKAIQKYQTIMIRNTVQVYCVTEYLIIVKNFKLPSLTSANNWKTT